MLKFVSGHGGSHLTSRNTTTLKELQLKWPIPSPDLQSTENLWQDLKTGFYAFSPSHLSVAKLLHLKSEAKLSVSIYAKLVKVVMIIRPSILLPLYSYAWFCALSHHFQRRDMNICGCSMIQCENVWIYENFFAIHHISVSFRSTVSSFEHLLKWGNFSPSHSRVFSESVRVPVEHVNKRGRKGMWSQPPQIKNIQSLCVVVCKEKWGWLEEKEKQKPECHAQRSERHRRYKAKSAKRACDELKTARFWCHASASTSHVVRLSVLMSVSFTPAKGFKYSKWATVPADFNNAIASKKTIHATLAPR